jgi:hypothetical protein
VSAGEYPNLVAAPAQRKKEEEGCSMKPLSILMLAIAIAASVAAAFWFAAGHGDNEVTPLFGAKIPSDIASGNWSLALTKQARNASEVRLQMRRRSHLVGGERFVSRMEPSLTTSLGPGVRAQLRPCA